MEKTIEATILSKLKPLREARRWTQQEVADRLGVSQASYAGYENGKGFFRVGVFKKILDVYELNADYFFGKNDGHISKTDDEMRQEEKDRESMRLLADILKLDDEQLYQALKTLYSLYLLKNESFERATVILTALEKHERSNIVNLG